MRTLINNSLYIIGLDSYGVTEVIDISKPVM